jgi:hypothetical protein
VFVWAFFSFPVKKATQMNQTGGFENWLCQSPKQQIGQYGKARLEVLPAASPHQPNRFFKLTISFSCIYGGLPPSLAEPLFPCTHPVRED